eukprot:scaffold214857_cov51-Cyclotella_meneghiniana.AAC.2
MPGQAVVRVVVGASSRQRCARSKTSGPQAGDAPKLNWNTYVLRLRTDRSRRRKNDSSKDYFDDDSNNKSFNNKAFIEKAIRVSCVI